MGISGADEKDGENEMAGDGTGMPSNMVSLLFNLASQYPSRSLSPALDTSISTERVSTEVSKAPRLSATDRATTATTIASTARIAQEYWGYLMQTDRSPTPVFEQLILGVANYIVSTCSCIVYLHTNNHSL